MAKASAENKSRGKKREDEFPLLTYLDELVDELRKNVPKALKEFDIDGIHDARVCTRRLKAALGLLEQVLSDESREPFAKAMKKLRRRLGPLRDLDVMIEHLDEIAKAGRHALAAAWMKTHLEHERDDARKESGEQPGASTVLGRIGAWWGVREEIAEAQDAADNLLAQSLHLQLDAFAEQADLLSARISGTRQESAEAVSDPHGVRIAGKALRYTLEMARKQGHDIPGSVATAFKRMQDCLGLWHDYVVMTESAMRLSSSSMLAHHDSAAQRAVLDLARDVLAKADRELQKFTTLWNAKGADLAVTIRSAFPLSKAIQDPPAEVTAPDDPPSESKTDHGPPGSEHKKDPAETPQDVPSVA